ncbi:unnamed protein product [Brassica rapa subsp. trilocularis]
MSGDGTATVEATKLRTPCLIKCTFFFFLLNIACEVESFCCIVHVPN